MTYEEIQKDMIDALKAKDTHKKQALSSWLATIKNMTIEKKQKDNITQNIIEDALRKEIKTVKEQIETCPKDRTDLLDEYKAKLTTLECYAPKQLNESELKVYIYANHKNLITTKNKGQIMKTLMSELKSQDGKLINKVVDDLIKEMEV